MISAPRNMYGVDMFRLFYKELGMKRVCKILDVNEQTVSRWLREVVQVPKMAVLALYWESMYGRSLIDTDHFNELQMVYGQIRSLEDEVRKQQAVIEGLRQLQYGTANEPYFQKLRNVHAYSTGSYEFALPTTHSAADVSTGGEPDALANSHAQSGQKLSAMVEAQTPSQHQAVRALG
jgi:hypothetical protein